MNIGGLFRCAAVAAAALLASTNVLTAPAQAGGCNCPARCYCGEMAMGDGAASDDLRITDLDGEPAGDVGLGYQESYAALTGGNVALNDAGYIDNAIVGTQFRFRFDAAFNNPLPDRAEFFYPQCGCFTNGNGPGPPLPETSVDYQEFTSYLEVATSDRFSGFIEAPIRLINPEVNNNEEGFSDLNAGFKYALISCPDRYLTLQFRVYAPTGDGERGLGTSHASLEPALLFWSRQSPRWQVFGEFRDWIPLSDHEVNGENYAGNVLRYGLGSSYDLVQCCGPCDSRRLSAVTEFVGWTVLDGLALENGVPIDVSGDTIVNFKGGARYTVNQDSFYAGYGRALTGDVWYTDILRLEYRKVF